MKDFLFKLLFRADFDHMGHLISDVVRLERENGELRNPACVESGSNSTTQYIDKEVE